MEFRASQATSNDSENVRLRCGEEGIGYDRSKSPQLHPSFGSHGSNDESIYINICFCLFSFKNLQLHPLFFRFVSLSEDINLHLLLLFVCHMTRHSRASWLSSSRHPPSDIVKHPAWQVGAVQMSVQNCFIEKWRASVFFFLVGLHACINLNIKTTRSICSAEGQVTFFLVWLAVPVTKFICKAKADEGKSFD